MKIRTIVALSILLIGMASVIQAADRPDILIADFEGETYADWKTTGDAFGPGPARGTLPGQMEVTGFLGKGLVNSFYKGDTSTGTLTSPPIVLERKFINFLIGGGMHPGKTCMNLKVDGKVVRTATGPNDKAGGSERLDWHNWYVDDLAGKSAVFEIVDMETGGWGHINIDHIVQSDVPKGIVEVTRDMVLSHDYLSFRFAAKMGPKIEIMLLQDGKPIRRAVGRGSATPSLFTWDVSRLRGKKLQLRVVEPMAENEGDSLAKSVVQCDEPRGSLIVVDKLYRESYRPQFHFTPIKNWTNDPNGMVFYAGEYHLFFQHNPTGIQWGNMTWGHALSPDMVHWKQLDHAIYPDKLGTIFSGSAVVDWNNTSGFQTGTEKVLVSMYTSAGKPFTQSLAYSNDRGRTWTKYAKNPVIGHVRGDNRDPKVIWHEPTKSWIMVLYLDGIDYAIYGSPNLKEWKLLDNVQMAGTSECPDFFPLPVDGDATKTKWVFWGANGNYLLGSFDGKKFKAETEPLKSLWGANDYAAQTYSDIPAADGRRIQIAWMSGGSYPDMPFNQQMTFPREMTLRSTADGPRPHLNPIREIERLHAAKKSWLDLDLRPGDDPLASLSGDLWDIEAEIEPHDAKELAFSVRGESIRFDAKTSLLHCLGRSAAVMPQNGVVKLRILVDRTSIEIFAADGLVTMCSCFLPDLANHSLALTAQGGIAKVKSLTVHEVSTALPAVTWQAADASVTLAAQDAEVHGQQLRYEPVPKKNTLGYWTKVEDWASWQFEITRPGEFTMEIFQGCGAGQGGSEVEFAVAGQTLKIAVEDTGHFQNFKSRTIGKIKLSEPGRYDLTVKPKTKPGVAIMDLRSVILRPVSD